MLPGSQRRQPLPEQHRCKHSTVHNYAPQGKGIGITVRPFWNIAKKPARDPGSIQQKPCLKVEVGADQ